MQVDFLPRVKRIVIRDIPINYYINTEILESYTTQLESKEPDTLDWIDNFENESIFYDVGASTGPFTLYCALKSHAKVFCFEPEAQNYSVLEMNHYLNRKNIMHGITSFMIAIGETSSLLPLYIKRYGAGWAMKIVNKSVRRLETESFEPDHIQQVIVESLDDLIEKYDLPFPNYLKIDADESEYEIIKGSKKTLRSPTLKSVLIELIDDDERTKKILEIMKENRFVIRSKQQVEDYAHLYNYIFFRENNID